MAFLRTLRGPVGRAIVAASAAVASLSHVMLVEAEQDTRFSTKGFDAKVLLKPDDSEIRRGMIEMISDAQNLIRQKVNSLEEAACAPGETPVRCIVDVDDRRKDGKFGVAVAIQDGRVFEKGAASMTVMSKPLSAGMVRQMSSNHAGLKQKLAEVDDSNTDPFKMWVCGLSLIMHPRHPLGATVHLNYRYFEVMKGEEVVAWWFGGGNDLTPIYFNLDDAIHFHKTLKTVCDRHDEKYYPEFKDWADKYFYHKARKEARGVGGIFFDDLHNKPKEELFAFVTDCLGAFIPAYFPTLESKLDQPVTMKMKEWQALRHGRYVEFNLVYDRGTKFGFQVPGVNIENVLISLPLSVRFEYKNLPKPFSAEAELLSILTGPPLDYAALLSKGKR